MASLLLILLPVLVLARIEIELFDKEGDGLALVFSGREMEIITDQQVELFGLEDKVLKDAIKAIYGKSPDDVYIHSPTPNGDLYLKHGWDPVMTLLTPTFSKILRNTSRPDTIMSQIFENNSSKPANFNVGITREVHNIVSVGWTKDNHISVGQDLDIGIKVLGTTIDFSYAYTWGNTSVHSQSVTVGSTSALGLDLKPGQAVIATLQATKGSTTYEMVYEASLTGVVVINYKEAYKGHHFYSCPIENVMSAANLTNKQTFRQIFDVSLYSNAKLVVQDVEGRSK